MKKLLLIGLQTSSVDFEKWPELSPEKLEAAFVKVREEFESAGYAATWCLTDSGETAREKVIEALSVVEPDIVMIGAGVRTDPDHFLLFESLINVVHEMAPGAKFAFNTNPLDSVAAVERQLGSD